MPTGLSWQRLASGQIWRRYERSTDETVRVDAPVHFYDDFLGADVVIPATGSDESGCLWTKSASTGTVAKDAVAANGRIKCATTTASSDQKAILCWDNQFGFSIGNATAGTKYAQAEFKFRFNTLSGANDLGGHHLICGVGQTVTADVTGTNFFDAGMTVVAGLDIGPGPNTASATEDVSIYLSCDDTASDVIPDTGVDAVEDTDYVFRIDFTDLEDVKFYLNGTRLLGGSTFDFSTLTAAEGIVQPYFGCYKHTTEGDGEGMEAFLDYVRLWSIR